MIGAICCHCKRSSNKTPPASAKQIAVVGVAPAVFKAGSSGCNELLKEFGKSRPVGFTALFGRKKPTHTLFSTVLDQYLCRRQHCRPCRICSERRLGTRGNGCAGRSSLEESLGIDFPFSFVEMFLSIRTRRSWYHCLTEERDGRAKAQSSRKKDVAMFRSELIALRDWVELTKAIDTRESA